MRNIRYALMKKYDNLTYFCQMSKKVVKISVQSDLLFQTTGLNCCLNFDSQILAAKGGEHYGYCYPDTHGYCSYITVLQ